MGATRHLASRFATKAGFALRVFSRSSQMAFGAARWSGQHGPTKKDRRHTIGADCQRLGARAAPSACDRTRKKVSRATAIDDLATMFDNMKPTNLKAIAWRGLSGQSTGPTFLRLRGGGCGLAQRAPRRRTLRPDRSNRSLGRIRIAGAAALLAACSPRCPRLGCPARASCQAARVCGSMSVPLGSEPMTSARRAAVPAGTIPSL